MSVVPQTALRPPLITTNSYNTVLVFIWALCPQEHISQIMDMGFAEDMAKNALTMTNNDVQRALDMLLG